ncbi:uncharacterized protein LOC105181706 [Harpegnathos saltator]|uniref:uncharacterized protein LOC105181706 n=1 Tax=Harpegnathos saltator TaxID=610380 RepID=UPI000DBED5CE|nr:uncharacterized protein LOC105181706 [Harpegnathos saltator]
MVFKICWSLRPRDSCGYQDAVSTDADAAPEDPVRAEQSRLEDPQQNAADSVCCVSGEAKRVSITRRFLTDKDDGGGVRDLRRSCITLAAPRSRSASQSSSN